MTAMKKMGVVLLTVALATPSFAQRDKKKTDQSKPAAAAPADNANAQAAAQPQIPEKLYEGMRYRLVGPFRGGRVLAVAGDPKNPSTYYFGAVSGGVWKTTD